MIFRIIGGGDWGIRSNKQLHNKHISSPVLFFYHLHGDKLFSLNEERKKKKIKIHKEPIWNQATSQSKNLQQKLQSRNYIYSVMWAFYGTDIFILVQYTCSFHCIWGVPHIESPEPLRIFPDHCTGYGSSVSKKSDRLRRIV